MYVRQIYWILISGYGVIVHSTQRSTFPRKSGKFTFNKSNVIKNTGAYCNNKVCTNSFGVPTVWCTS